MTRVPPCAGKPGTVRHPSVRRHARRLATGLLSLVLLAGCAVSPPAPPATPAAQATLERVVAEVGTPTTPTYTFAPGDEFDLRVPDAPQFDQAVRVRPDGKIALPLVGTVHVLGRTPEDVQSELRERIARRAGSAGQREYLLHANDELEIKFPFHANLNEQLRVRPDGKLQLQLVGTVQAEGRSPESLRDELRERYAKWLRNPEVAVLVRGVTSQNVRTPDGTGRAGLAGLEPVIVLRNPAQAQVFVGGEIVRPGVLVWRPGLSLVQAVVESGGVLPSGDRAQLTLLRRNATGGAEVLRLGERLDPLGQPAQDITLQPYDVVLLPKSRAATLADQLNQYVFNLIPPLRNSSFGFVYPLRDSNN